MTATSVTIATSFNGITTARSAPRRPIEKDPLEPLVSAALLTATAFRLRDREGLHQALRLLVSASDEVERTVLESAA